MKHELIQTENYLLIVDDSEIKVGDLYLNQTGNVIEKLTYRIPSSGHWCKKIIAHLPLKNSPVLEGVDLLPPIEDDDKEVWETGLEAELKKLPYTKHLDDGQYNDGQLVGFELGATWGYNKAKDKYKYTEEDLRIALSESFKASQEGYNITSDEIIQSLQQPKYPVGFECEMKKDYRKNDDGEKIGLPVHETNVPKTTTNSQGQTVWVGKYIFND